MTNRHGVRKTSQYGCEPSFEPKSFCHVRSNSDDSAESVGGYRLPVAQSSRFLEVVVGHDVRVLPLPAEPLHDGSDDLVVGLVPEVHGVELDQQPVELVAGADLVDGVEFQDGSEELPRCGIKALGKFRLRADPTDAVVGEPGAHEERTVDPDRFALEDADPLVLDGSGFLLECSLAGHNCLPSPHGSGASRLASVCMLVFLYTLNEVRILRKYSQLIQCVICLSKYLGYDYFTSTKYVNISINIPCCQRT